MKKESILTLRFQVESARLTVRKIHFTGKLNRSDVVTQGAIFRESHLRVQLHFRLTEQMKGIEVPTPTCVIPSADSIPSQECFSISFLF